MISRRAFIATSAGLLVPAPFVLAQRVRRMGGQQWSAGSVAFDGSTSYATVQRAMSPDTKVATVSLWVKMNPASNDAAVQYFCECQQNAGNGSSRLLVARDGSGYIWFRGTNSSSATVLNVLASSSSNKVLAATGWVHVYFRVNMDVLNDATIALNGVVVSSNKSVFTQSEEFDIDCSGTPPSGGPYCIVAGASTSAPFYGLYGSLSEIWYADTDLGEGGYAAFRNGNQPAYLGPTGIVSGVTPRLYLSRSSSEPVSAFFVNRGSTGGTFTQAGAPALDSSTVAKP